MTVKGVPFTMISRPSGSPSPKSRSLVTVVSTTTRAALRASCSVNARPSIISGAPSDDQLPVYDSMDAEGSCRSRYFTEPPQYIAAPTVPAPSRRPSASISAKVMGGFCSHLQVSPVPSHASNVIG